MILLLNTNSLNYMSSLIRLELVHLFARMDDQIDETIKNERVHKLITLSDQLAKEYASKFEDEVLEVIPEEGW